jgi:hypothetical protein
LIGSFPSIVDGRVLLVPVFLSRPIFDTSRLCPGIDLPRSEPEAELLPPEAKIQLERIQLLRKWLFRSRFLNWPLINDLPGL